MDEKNTPSQSCIDCGSMKCSRRKGEYPDFCLTTSLEEAQIEEIMECYREPENNKAMITAANIEFEGYYHFTRLEETLRFAHRMGMKKIGIATCAGLIRESRTLARVFRANGFEVFGVVCKVGAIDKTEVGIDAACHAVGVNMCNPILQAKLLNKEGTELNIVVGLCVGHDCLFYKYSNALTTTLVTKDRVAGHNPVSALYNADGYYRRKLFKNGIGQQT